MSDSSPLEAKAKTGIIRYLPQLKLMARRNRQNPTLAESLCWKLLKDKQTSFRFLRQKPLGRFIIDFYCPRLLLAIEIDGNWHHGRQLYDQDRERYLNQRGIKTLRFSNTQVFSQPQEVAKILKQEINQRIVELKNN
jgi:very-short-patch-repair endonuclease